MQSKRSSLLVLSPTKKFLLASAVAFCTSACSPKEVPDAGPSPGELMVKNNCKVCHAQGINGAPIIGNIKMWGPRLEKGTDALVANAIAGVGLMPPKAGKPELTDEQMRIAVEYMLSQVANK